MAKVLYPAAKQAILNKEIDLDTDDIRPILIDTADYTYSAAHDFLEDVASGARVATGGSALASRTLTNGTFDAADYTFPSVTGDSVEAVILYLHTGNEATARLIAYIDGISATPDGSDFIVQWDAAGIFSLADA